MAGYTRTTKPKDANVQTHIEEDRKAKVAALQYIDWLVTTCNESMPNEYWHTPVPHPCAVPPSDISDVDEDYHSLVNTVQQHTQCSTAHCLRSEPGHQHPQCRFGYPREEQSYSTNTFEKLDDVTVRATLATKQNDPRLNSHNRVMLQH